MTTITLNILVEQRIYQIFYTIWNLNVLVEVTVVECTYLLHCLGIWMFWLRLVAIQNIYHIVTIWNLYVLVEVVAENV